MAALTLDTHEFTRLGASSSGLISIVDQLRLASMLASADGTLAWQLTGRSEQGAMGSRRGFLSLSCSGSVVMTCVRCLAPMMQSVAFCRQLRLVSSEAQAEKEDPADDEFDVIVGSRCFDLGELIEDELIMALPSAPRHPDCAVPHLYLES